MRFFEKLKNFDHNVFIWFIAFLQTPYPWILMVLSLVAFDVHRYLTEGKFETLDLPMILFLLFQAYYVPKAFTQNMKDKKDKN